MLDHLQSKRVGGEQDGDRREIENIILSNIYMFFFFFFFFSNM
jgi:hypothetical protein